jgi:hypothetical protein
MALPLSKTARLLAGCAAMAGATLSFTAVAEARPAPHNYVGFAFDTCSAPSIRTLHAWLRSPFRALNIYIGGADRACSQPHLTAGWVRAVTHMGWRLIPTYVSLQAPRTSCRCHSMNPRRANFDGVAAAANAVHAARWLGIGRGNPIYDDMEAYSMTSMNTGAVMAFLEGWTGRLHRLGYLSGVYSSSGSGITELAQRVDSRFVEPNDIWIAAWNRRPTADPSVPAGEWSRGYRIHQYRGPHTDDYGGARINIDSDYCRAAVVKAGTLGLR